MSEESLATCVEVAQFLRVKPSTVRRLVSEGEIPGFKVGRQWRFSMDVIRAWAQERSGHDELGICTDPEGVCAS